MQRSFVTPINRLRLVAKQVIQGDLSQRIELSGSHDEITETLTVFNEMLDELQETQKKRNTFIATLTHDMKTPLIAQKNVLSIFENEFKQLGKNELARLSNSLVKNNISMLGMIEMLLDVEKYREGKVQLCFENIQAEDFIDQCVEKLTSLAKEKNILIESTINQNASSFIADPKQLERVLTNLVVNAIENIPEKSKVTITLSSIGNSLLMKVCDNGQGLDPELQDVIFDKYVSGEKKAQKIGSGLGLYICKLIVSLHKGSIEIKPNPEGRGTCFIVMLPQNASL